MNCTCNNQIYRSTVGTIALNSGSTAVVMTPDTPLATSNTDKVALIITTSVPTTGMNLPVEVTLAGASCNVLDKYGNIVYGAELRTRYVMKGYYGTNGVDGTTHLQLVNFPIGR